MEVGEVAGVVRQPVLDRVFFAAPQPASPPAASHQPQSCPLSRRPGTYAAQPGNTVFPDCGVEEGIMSARVIVAMRHALRVVRRALPDCAVDIQCEDRDSRFVAHIIGGSDCCEEREYWHRSEVFAPALKGFAPVSRAVYTCAGGGDDDSIRAIVG